MGWSGWEVDSSLSGMNKSINSFIVGPQMFYLKFIHVRDSSCVFFLCFPRRLLGFLLNQDKELEIILALNSYLTKDCMWADQLCIKSYFLCFQRNCVYYRKFISTISFFSPRKKIIVHFFIFSDKSLQEGN